ncbi:MAG: hypothetical protein EOM87_08695 [Clostridia bacterium]|nr:hypothetical protein [Clostridia bacterium]
MCGFIGMFKNDALLTLEDKHDIEKMSALISHRGPDQNACVFHAHAGFGFRRLSIIDLSGGDQPYVSPDGRYTSVYNGEVYNYLELRDDLIKKGEKLYAASVVVLLHL